ncbi:MAG: TIGR03960 family B12-binding radical SAM protein [Planctomycetales bacterium]|nr:TIGR03960 family B12-binding radical SAM protein [Planctomycetales bacterium]
MAVPDTLGRAVRRLLPQVQTPAQYVGGERNQVVRDWERRAVRVALAFPDTYGVGMSHLGLKIFYDIVNRRPDALAERCFSPWFDMEAAMRAAGIPLFSLESHRPVRAFDVLGVSLQYEALYTNFLAMLDLAGIPLRSRERGEQDPIVVAGGPGTTAPEPVADFVDVFLLGDGEECFPRLLDLVAERKRTGSRREDFLRAVARGVEGAYVPSLYDVSYHPDGTVCRVLPRHADVPGRVPQAVVHDFAAAPYPTAPPVPYVDVVHDRITLEIMRGCVHGCRFCHAGYTKRPMRYRPPEQLVRLAEETYRNTGLSEIGLTSLSSSDYPELVRLMGLLNERFRDRSVSLSLPSLRVNEILATLPHALGEVRKSGLTLAPEVATDRLRRIVNKPILNEDLFNGVRELYRAGWSQVKVYFMIGIPGEVDDDVDGIARMAERLVQLRREAGKGPGWVNATISPFVPKPHTPFQWEPQVGPERIREISSFLRGRVRDRHVRLKVHDAEWSGVEGILSRGDRRLGAVVERVMRAGGRMDGWSEGFRLERWRDAMAAEGLDPAFYLARRRSASETLPWDHLGAGVTKGWLARDLEKARREETAPGCWSGSCSACGLNPKYECTPGWSIQKLGWAEATARGPTVSRPPPPKPARAPAAEPAAVGS